MDASNDTRRAKEDETTEDHGHAVPPVNATSQHHEADRCNSNHCGGSRDRSEKGVLEPADRRNQDAGPRRIRIRILSRRRR